MIKVREKYIIFFSFMMNHFSLNIIFVVIFVSFSDHIATLKTWQQFFEGRVDYLHSHHLNPTLPQYMSSLCTQSALLNQKNSEDNKTEKDEKMKEKEEVTTIEEEEERLTRGLEDDFTKMQELLRFPNYSNE